MTPPPDSVPLTDVAGDERALNDRRAAILEAVVTEYIGTAEPVGSSHVANAPGVQVSSATVRSEMVALEREGYLVQPHTSAGRIPTDKGYRFFVDQLTGPGVLGPIQRKQVTQFFDQVHGEMETVLERASGLLSELTSYAAVVVGPSHETATIRSVQLVGLSPLHALLVVVLSDGAVEKRTIDLQAETSDDVLARAGTQLASHLVGRTLTQPWTVPPSGSAEVDHLVTSAHGAFDSLEGAWRPTRCSSAARPAWPSRSTPSRRSAPSWPSLSSSWSSSRCCATSSTVGSRWPSGPSTASSRCRRAPSSWRRCRSTGRTSARWGCSARRAWTTPGPWPPRMSWASASGNASAGERWPSLTGSVTSTRCSGSVPTPATTRSSGPTAPAPASCTPTPTTATPKPRRSSSR